MGVDIHVFIVKRNEETDKWDRVSLYRHDHNGKLILTEPLWGWRNSEMFRLIQEDLPSSPIKWTSLGKGKEEIEKYKEYTGFYHFAEINLLKLKAYLKKYPKIRDYDAEDEYYALNGKESEPLMKKNPIKTFYKHIMWYIEFAESWVGDVEDYKVIYFFDH